MTTRATGKSRQRQSSAKGDRRTIRDIRQVHQILNHTFLSGVYLAHNAIPDTQLLFDGPYCGYEKAFLVGGTHDLFSSFFDIAKGHRITCTHINANALIHDREERILDLIEQISHTGGSSLVLLVAMPMASITGIDYAAIAAKATSRYGIAVEPVPGRYFKYDWIDGYDEVLCLIARSLNLSSGRRKKGCVGIVGYLFDRNEGDHVGNVAELRRILSQVGLETASIWLEGADLNRLKEIETAQIIISLPYGRRAALEIAKRTGAELVLLDLPVGLKASRMWLERLANLGATTDATTRLLASELEQVIPLVDLVVSDYLRGTRFAFYGDPFLAEATMTAMKELGSEPDHAVIFGTQEAMTRLANREIIGSIQTLACARVGDILDLDLSQLDFLMGNSHAHSFVKARYADKPFLEIGFPSYKYHCLASSPYIFFRGFVNLLNRIVNVL